MSRMGLLAFLSEEDLSSAFEESVSTVNRGDYHCECDGWIDGFFERNFSEDFVDADDGWV